MSGAKIKSERDQLSEIHILLILIEDQLKEVTPDSIAYHWYTWFAQELRIALGMEVK